MDIDRDLIMERYHVAMSKSIDWSAVPIEAGVHGCPFKLLVCSIIRYPIDRQRQQSLRACRDILEVWPSADRLAGADHTDLVALLDDLTHKSRRARILVKMATVFLSDEWTTLYDLPGFGTLAETYMRKYCK